MVEEVLIKYVDSSLAAKFGSQPFKTSLHLAQQYEARGLAVILNRPPSANPSPSPQKLKEEHEKQQAAYMAEQEALTRVSWITTTYVDRTLMKVGENLGFRVEVHTPTAFSIHRILTAELLIIESSLKGFTHNQITDLRAAQFQKEKPFVFRVINYETSDAFKQNLMRAKLVVFAKDKLLDNAKELYGDLFANYCVEQEDEWYSLWKEVDRIINPLPQNVGRNANILEPKVEEDFFGKITLPSTFDANAPDPTLGIIDPPSPVDPAPDVEDNAWMDEIVSDTIGKKK